MTIYLDSQNFPCKSAAARKALDRALVSVVTDDLKDNVFAMLGRFQQILSDNRLRDQWDGVFEKLKVLFMCGRNATLDGPMIGVPMAIRDSDYFRETARLFGKDRSLVAKIEWMASCWNATFANTGLWMGKTFEPVAFKTFSAMCGGDPDTLALYDPGVVRIGRNFFRRPANPDFIQGLGLPVLTQAWNLLDRPARINASGFAGELSAENLAKETHIPYSKTGGIFLSLPGASVVDEMNGKAVYQLNYRWPALEPVYPMTRLIDEVVQISDGVYLGQLVMASRHYSLGTLRIPIPGPREGEIDFGESYQPSEARSNDYGYQNNGFFLMIEPRQARQAYADEAFPHLRPRPGESGYVELGYDKHLQPTRKRHIIRRRKGSSVKTDPSHGWQHDKSLSRKFTTFCCEESPNGNSDEDVRELLHDGETILQMLQRIQGEITAASRSDDHLRHFEKLNRLFRRGVAPCIANGVFQGQGQGYNTRFDAPESRMWYGSEDPCTGFDYYHGATLNLHLGVTDTLSAEIERRVDAGAMFPSALASMLQGEHRGPNVLNAVWATIGRHVFPWAGKSFERISERKLSMLLDESDDLAIRYPERVSELRSHLASWPHYDLVQKNHDHFWQEAGVHRDHLASGPWDSGMSAEDKAYWQKEALEHWVFGSNLQDARILSADAAFRALDMNYHPPISSIQKLTDNGPSPFVRQGYIFLGTSGRESILPMNNGDWKKKVFQFHYRYPMIGGPAPIGTCLDEIVEIAEGLFLGQLIYSTVPFVPFHSSVNPVDYKYQLFGYFLLLDNTWETHRRAIGFDVNTLT